MVQQDRIEVQPFRPNEVRIYRQGTLGADPALWSEESFAWSAFAWSGKGRTYDVAAPEWLVDVPQPAVIVHTAGTFSKYVPGFRTRPEGLVARTEKAQGSDAGALAGFENLLTGTDAALATDQGSIVFAANAWSLFQWGSFTWHKETPITDTSGGAGGDAGEVGDFPPAMEGEDDAQGADAGTLTAAQSEKEWSTNMVWGGTAWA